MNISRNKYGFVTFLISLLCLIGTTVFLISVWKDTPEIVASHYNFAGEVDGTSGKNSLIVSLGIGWILFVGLTVLMQFPQIWNTGVKVTERNRRRVYKILRDLLSTTRMMITFIFCLMVVQSSGMVNIPSAAFPALMIALFSSMIFFIVRLVRAR